MTYDTVATVIAAASATAAAAAALGAFTQVRAANEATLAELFLAFSERYNSPEMALAMRALAGWYRATPDSRFRDWVKEKHQLQPAALELNRHRRLVSRYFFDIARLRYMKLISKRYAHELAENNGLNVFYKICEPMNIINHPHKIERYARTLRSICKQYADGSIYESAPAPQQ